MGLKSHIAIAILLSLVAGALYLYMKDPTIYVREGEVGEPSTETSGFRGNVRSFFELGT